MDIFTIVRANIKAHIGQFIGIILMMCIAVTSILSFAGVIFSVGDSVEMCNELAKTADTTIIIPKVNVTDEMMDTLKSKDEFESVNAVDVLGIHNVKNSSNEKYVYHSQTFIMPDSGRYPLIKDDMSDFSSEKLSAKKGEIYFAAGLASEINVKPGEKVTLVCEASKLELTFAGYLEDPWGSSTMGWKHVIVSQEDFDSFVKEVHDEYDEYGGYPGYYSHTSASTTTPKVDMIPLMKIEKGMYFSSPECSFDYDDTLSTSMEFWVDDLGNLYSGYISGLSDGNRIIYIEDEHMIGELRDDTDDRRLEFYQTHAISSHKIWRK